MNEEIKSIFNRWDTFQSFEKDVMIINYLADGKEHRQKEIVDTISPPGSYSPPMAPPTVKKHLYKLVKKGIIKESRKFRGTYYMDDPPSFSKIVKALLGEPVYEALLNEWVKGFSDYEKREEWLRSEEDHRRYE